MKCLNVKTRHKLKILLFFISLTLFGTQTIYAIKLCDSTFKSFDSLGYKTKVEKWKNGQACGAWLYYENGFLTKKEKYKKGILHYTLFYNKIGKVITTVDRKGKVRNYKPCNCK